MKEANVFEFFTGSLKYFLVPFRNGDQTYEACILNKEAKCRRYSSVTREKEKNTVTKRC